MWFNKGVKTCIHTVWTFKFCEEILPPCGQAGRPEEGRAVQFFTPIQSSFANTCKYSVGGCLFGHTGTVLTAITVGESEEFWVGGGGVKFGETAHIWLSASRDEWLGDNRASAAGRKMIPLPRCGTRPCWRGLFPAPPDPHLLPPPVGKCIRNTREVFFSKFDVFMDNSVWVWGFQVMLLSFGTDDIPPHK